MLTRARLAIAVAAAVLVAHVALHAQEASLTSEVSRLVELLELRSNSVVADVGAGVAKETVIEELKAAGFEIVTVLPEWPGNLFLVLARKPAR